MLADGCTVPACGVCYSMIEKGKKIAEERGLYDPNKIRGGGNVMGEIPEVVETDGVAYIGKKLYQEKNVRKVKIKNEFKMTECNYQGKITIKPVGLVETGVVDPKEARWEMNKATQKWMRDTYGSDSSQWVGKEIEIKLASAGNAQASIYPIQVSLEKTF
ncbi:MAG: hypothetical protein O6761_05425 [Thaumarchaeota archaeon]|nr:hypothetical protein [Nitrososphaerota archaeon]